MSLSTIDKATLEEITQLSGKCLDSGRCNRCPFRAICLPEFLNPIPPSEEQRLKMAQDVLTHHYLIDSDMDLDEITRDYKWDKK